MNLIPQQPGDEGPAAPPRKDTSGRVPTGPNLVAARPRLQLTAGIAILAFLVVAFVGFGKGYLPLAGAGFVFAGATCGLLAMPDVVSTQPRFLQVVLALLGAAMLYLTYVLYQQPSFACIFPGITVAFAGGQLLGAYLRFVVTGLRRTIAIRRGFTSV